MRWPSFSLSLLLLALSMIQFNSNLARACHHLESPFMHEAEILHGNTQPALRLHSYTAVLLSSLSSLNRKERGTAKVNGSRPISYDVFGSIGLALIHPVAQTGSPKLKDHKA